MEAVGVWGATPSRGSGIGKAVALSLLQNDEKEIYVFGRSKTKLEDLLTKYPRIKGSFQWDLKDESVVKSYEEYLIRNKISSIVDAIGSGYPGPLPFLGLNEMREMIESNILVPFMVIKSSLVPMKHLGKGRIISFGSIVSFKPSEGSSGYVASKTGLRGLLESARFELKMGFKGISLHGLYSQNIERVGMKTVTDSVSYLLSLPYGSHADLVVDG